MLKNYTWRELCLDYAGGLVEELGYDGGQEEPPGGFEGLYKLVTYCPGFHFPTSDYVLRASAIYSWRYGLGHLEMSPKCFLTGDDARAALFLAPCFAKDEFSVSHLCCHDQAIDQSAEYSPPPLYACRGIVKDFKSSELARACGAAAHLQQRQSDLEGARDKEALPCPYCEELVFPLKPEDIPHAYTCYETLYLDCVEAVHPDCREDSLSAYNSVSDSEAESEPEIKVEPERVLVSGFACLAGHIVLQVAGYPGRHPGTQIEDSGEMLRLGSSNAVAFLTEHAAENGILRYKEGQSLVDELEFDQLIKVADRLEELEDEWPSFVASARPYIRVAGVYPWRPISENPSLSKEMLRGSGLPHKVADGLYDYVLRGEPDLAHCMELLFEAVEAQVQEYLLRERREEVLVALQEAGFERSSITHEESVDKYVQVRRLFARKKRRWLVCR